jgi:hypothetical protein
MQIETAFTVEALDEAAGFNRRWHYWPLFFVRNVRGFIIYLALFVIAIGNIIKDLGKPTHNIAILVAGTLGTVALIAYPIWGYGREKQKRQALLSKQGSLLLTLSAEGLAIREHNGVNTFVPWNIYSGFREGKYIFAIQQVDPPGFRAIPKDAATAQAIRSFLLSKLPELHS